MRRFRDRLRAAAAVAQATETTEDDDSVERKYEVLQDVPSDAKYCVYYQLSSAANNYFVNRHDAPDTWLPWAYNATARRVGYRAVIEGKQCVVCNASPPVVRTADCGTKRFTVLCTHPACCTACLDTLLDEIDCYAAVQHDAASLDIAVCIWQSAVARNRCMFVDCTTKYNIQGIADDLPSFYAMQRLAPDDLRSVLREKSLHASLAWIIHVNQVQLREVQVDLPDVPVGSVIYSVVGNGDGTTKGDLWHGSRLCNWASILNSGFKVLSNTSQMTSGAVYGVGVYLSDNFTTSDRYCTDTALNSSVGENGWSRSKFGLANRIMARCAMRKKIRYYHRTANIFVCDKPDEIIIQYIVVRRMSQ